MALFPWRNQLQPVDATTLECDKTECGICLDEFTKPVRLSCGHIFCDVCIRTHLDNDSRCPLDRSTIHYNLSKTLKVAFAKVLHKLDDTAAHLLTMPLVNISIEELLILHLVWLILCGFHKVVNPSLNSSASIVIDWVVFAYTSRIYLFLDFLARDLLTRVRTLYETRTLAIDLLNVRPARGWLYVATTAEAVGHGISILLLNKQRVWSGWLGLSKVSLIVLGVDVHFALTVLAILCHKKINVLLVRRLDQLQGSMDRERGRQNGQR